MKRLVITMMMGAVSSVFGVGIRHDVAEEEYKKLGGNEGKYKAGEGVPNFSPVCALVEGVGANMEVTGTGTLVHPRFVLTAAHCVLEGDRAKRLLTGVGVRFGANTRKWSKIGKVKKIHLPKSVKSSFYRPFGELNRFYTNSQEDEAYRHDFALIELEQVVMGIEPAVLDYENELKVGRRLFFAGYGVVASGNERKERRFKEAQYRMAGENVLDRVVEDKKYQGGMLVFDFDNGSGARNSLGESLSRYKLRNFGKGKSERKPLAMEGAAYSGDSGGPAMMKINGEWRVVGVCSYGTGYPVNSSRGLMQYGEINCYTYLKPHAKWFKKVLGE